MLTLRAWLTVLLYVLISESVSLLPVTAPELIFIIVISKKKRNKTKTQKNLLFLSSVLPATQVLQLFT